MMISDWEQLHWHSWKGEYTCNSSIEIDYLVRALTPALLAIMDRWVHLQPFHRSSWIDQCTWTRSFGIECTRNFNPGILGPVMHSQPRYRHSTCTQIQRSIVVHGSVSELKSRPIRIHGLVSARAAAPMADMDCWVQSQPRHGHSWTGQCNQNYDIGIDGPVRALAIVPLAFMDRWVYSQPRRRHSWKGECIRTIW